MNELALMQQKQKRLMAILGIELDPRHPKYRAQLISAAMGAMCEAGEVCSDLNTLNRPWRPMALEDIRDHAIEESVDTLFYLMEFWNLLELSPEDVFTVFLRKYKKNLNRILATISKPSLAYYLRVIKHVCMSESPSGLRATDISTVRAMHAGEFNYDLSKRHQKLAAVYTATFGLNKDEMDNFLSTIVSKQDEQRA
jgi:hypothetical protein